ncbi:membrane-associated zinc metalloprotease [Filimonas lacunae]|nr:membrane-associated zinc metalloprotease [Filimonas lacunae]
MGVKILQFILSFSILVTLHELGHFLTARWFKCRVEKFYLFFNPWFSLWKKKVGDTEYGIGWVPFGGYVKISGMMDESMDKDAMKLPPQPYEFRSKPAWQRLIIMIAGVVVNVLLALALFVMITYVWGEEYIPIKNVSYGIHADSLGRSIGLQDGDKIVALDGKPAQTLEQVAVDVVLKEGKVLTVDRKGQELNISIPDDFAKKLNKARLVGFIDYNVPVIVDTVVSEAKFTKDSLRKGDQVIALDGQPAAWFYQFDSLKRTRPDKQVAITVLRGVDTVEVKAILNGTRVGFGEKKPFQYYGTEVKQYTLGQAIPKGVSLCFEKLGQYITGIKQIFTGKVAAKDSLGSVISIGNAFPGIWDWERFWTLTALFSIILAFMNILPIPALDGGHALFTLVEMVSGRKPSDKFMEYAQIVGMVLLLSLMVYALGLDVTRLFKH